MGDGGESPRPQRTRPDRREEARAPAHRRRAEDRDAPELPERYEHRGPLGEGGQGEVFRVFDRQLRREVALKALRPERRSHEDRRQFLEEARAGASLEHPNVAPIYDVGELRDGRPFYTLRLVSGRTLGHVLRTIARRRPPEWTLLRLAAVLQQLSRGLQAAHEVGLIHRDVKPENVLVGKLDEVLLVDWGIAKVTAPGTDTKTDVVKGTVHYLAPEQVRGATRSPSIDLHALGVILYQVLTLKLPFQEATEGETIAAILRDEPKVPSEVSNAPWPVPPELEDLALRLLRKRPEERPSSAREVADELRAYLEGLRERERRWAAAEEQWAEGRTALARHEAARSELAEMAAAIERLEGEHPSWQPVQEKRPLLEARSRAEQLERGAWTSFLEGVNHLTDALVHVPHHAGARVQLSGLFWERFLHAEERGEAALAETYRMLVERWHDGRFERELAGHGGLRVELHPEGAEAVLHPLVEKDLVLVDGPGRPLGRGDVALDELEMGSYVLTASAPGHETVRYPIRLGRCETWTGELRLPELGTLPEGFVFVQGTEAWLGGDAQATNSWPRRRVSVESFAIGRHPVTFGEWCRFLDELEPQERSDLIPHAEDLGPLCRWSEPEGRFLPLVGVERSEEFLELFGPQAVSEVPVFDVDLPMVEAFAAWRSAATGRPHRLPTSEEWELAARGVDERLYPWGHRFDAALCRVRDSTREGPYVPPIGASEHDCSVHGVRDLAGTVQEWTSSAFDSEHSLLTVRGGGWATGPTTSRSAWRGACPADTRSSQLGFRLACGRVS